MAAVLARLAGVLNVAMKATEDSHKPRLGELAQRRRHAAGLGCASQRAVLDNPRCWPLHGQEKGVGAPECVGVSSQGIIGAGWSYPPSPVLLSRFAARVSAAFRTFARCAPALCECRATTIMIGNVMMRWAFKSAPKMLKVII